MDALLESEFLDGPSLALTSCGCRAPSPQRHSTWPSLHPALSLSVSGCTRTGAAKADKFMGFTGIANTWYESQGAFPKRYLSSGKMTTMKEGCFASLPLNTIFIQSMMLEAVTYLKVLPTLTYKGLLGSVQFSHSVVSDSLPPHESQHARPAFWVRCTFFVAVSYLLLFFFPRKCTYVIV